MERRIQEFIRDRRLIADNAGVLVALSGGADSVALLRILERLGYRCHAVHCNFHLRGEESERDEMFTVELCESLNIPCEVIHFDTLAYAAERHVSIEMAARELRYREFERIRQAQGLDVIAVAHHQDDAVETFLLNLIRGAGINGLTGMHAINGRVVRPLLCITRDEIIDYLHQLKQSYVTDSTNLTDEYTRNKVRLNLLPMMQQINPAAKENISRTASHLAEASILYNKAIAEEKAHVIEGDEEPNISISALLATNAPKTILFETLHPYGFNPAQTDDIFRSLSAESGRIFYSEEHTVLRDRTHLLVRRKTPIEKSAHILPDEGTLTLPDGTILTITHINPDTNWQVPRSSEVLCIDAERFNGVLTLRHPQEGDRFRPFGMKGTKLLSDFYTDIRLPRTEKQRQWLLCHDNDILWAVGQRCSELCRVHGREQHVILVALTKNP